LFVEDHDDTRSVLQALLAREGHDVVTANCCDEARRAIDGGEFDLLLADVELPDGDGLELLPLLRARAGDHVKGVTLTGYGMDADIARSHEFGFERHLTKPVDFDQLRRALDEVMQTRTVGAAATVEMRGACSAPLV
jgi:CheY-like chemotaxis protein